MRAELHLRLSLLMVAAFGGLGLLLEALVGMRSEAWMGDALRRELLRLGHAHGALGGLLNVALAWAIERLSTPAGWRGPLRLAGLLGAGAMAMGFLGGGLWHGPTDPGPAVLLVPAGAFTLLAALLTLALLPRAAR